MTESRKKLRLMARWISGSAVTCCNSKNLYFHFLAPDFHFLVHGFQFLALGFPFLVSGAEQPAAAKKLRNSQAAPLFRPFFGSKDGEPKGPTEQ